MLCVRVRGMGEWVFRDLRSFNLAMLGKQIWPIIQYPNSLLNRVLKAKYFPSCDVLEAQLKPTASFTWKSIMCAMELVKQGVRWRIGYGTQVRIWQDNWLPRDYALKPFSPNLCSLGDATVSNLLVQETESWDTDLLRILLWEDDVKSILSIPVAGAASQDIQVWHYSKHGLYSIKTAYFLARYIRYKESTQRNGSTSSLMVFNWDFVWKMKIPNKVKVLCWRLLKQALPTLNNLRKRRVLLDTTCPVCCCGDESVLHLLHDCHYARVFWALSPIANHVFLSAASNVWDWVISVRGSTSQFDFEHFICSCWSVWSNRNKIVHEGWGYDP